MSAELISKNGNEVTVQFTVKLTGAMLNDEQALQQSLNEAGQVAMKPMLEQFDTNGEPIRINGIIAPKNGNMYFVTLSKQLKKVRPCEGCLSAMMWNASNRRQRCR